MTGKPTAKTGESTAWTAPTTMLRRRERAPWRYDLVLELPPRFFEHVENREALVHRFGLDLAARPDAVEPESALIVRDKIVRFI
jgi:hypothetical protein